MNDWPDLPGVTAVDGRARLPREPDHAALLLAEAIHGTHDGVTLPELVARVQRRVQVDRARLEGLAGWLPLSGVLAWRDGRLVADPATQTVDLALRYAAWLSTQPVPEPFAESSRAHAEAVVKRARELANSGALNPIPADGGLPLAPAAARGGPAPAHAAPTALTGKLRRLLAALDGAFLERGQHVRASLLALLGGQHVLLLGPPGTAKSMLARALCDCFADATYFEYLLSRFTHPDELFGPVSIPGLKDEDYRRVTDGFLPRAHVAFLDEIFKANSAILNSLLTLINERVFHHGRHRDPVPLIGVVGASNELPDPDGGLGALFDRFLVRLTVPPLATPDSFLSVATGQVERLALRDEDRITAAELEALRGAAAKVQIPEPIRDALVRLWRAAEQREWGCSDRRWRQAVGLLRTAAAADGRDQLSALDLLLLEPILTPDPSLAPDVREVLLQQLGSRSVPRHDLRAQWMLLGMDRVAPHRELPLTLPPPSGAAWPVRVEARATNLRRYLAHHEDAVAQLAGDRGAIERQADAHLWIARLPSQVLAAHIEAARDLAALLRAAERYADALASPDALARDALLRLPEVARRIYGYGAVVVVDCAGLQIGLTTAGEREPLPSPKRLEPIGGKVRPTNDPLFEVPLVTLTADAWLRFLDDGDVDAVLAGVTRYAHPQPRQALLGARRYLASALPPPPDVPAP